MRTLRSLLFIMVFFAAQPLLASDFQNKQHLNGQPDWVLCELDADCLMVESRSACPCGDTAVNREFLDEYFDSFKDISRDLTCELCPEAFAESARRGVCYNNMCTAFPEVISWRQCEAANDCMLVPDWGQCGCGQRAVNKDALSEFEVYRDEYHQSPEYLGKVLCKRCTAEGLVYEPQCIHSECVASISR